MPLVEHTKSGCNTNDVCLSNEFDKMNYPEKITLSSISTYGKW